MTGRFTLELSKLRYFHWDTCCVCHYKFIQNDACNSGYSADGTPLYVCDKCANHLVELAERNNYTPRAYLIPKDETVLWRYMDFSKFLSLLDSRSLYFARADHLGDPFEGARGRLIDKPIWDDHLYNFFKSATLNPPPGHTCTLTIEQVETHANKMLNEWNEKCGDSRKSHFVSCWHQNEIESEAMWKLYSTHLENALAVKTTKANLYKALGEKLKVKIGEMNYIDFSKEFPKNNGTFWTKRISFEHEREVRAMITDFDSQEIGKKVACDVTALINEVYISPTAPPWFANMVQSVSIKMGYNLRFNHSSLAESPLY